MFRYETSADSLVPVGLRDKNAWCLSSLVSRPRGIKDSHTLWKAVISTGSNELLGSKTDLAFKERKLGKLWQNRSHKCSNFGKAVDQIQDLAVLVWKADK